MGKVDMAVFEQFRDPVTGIIPEGSTDPVSGARYYRGGYIFPLSTKTPEELHEHQVKAGIASGKKKVMLKKQATILRQLLALDADDEERFEKLRELGFEGNFAESINYGIIQLAQKHDVEAARYIRDTIGEKPVSGLEIGIDDKPLAQMDMSKLSDEELQAYIAREEAEDAE